MKKEKKKFEGFPETRQTWNFPNIINGWVYQLTGAEFKCLWYILRHTYGWQKTEDAISNSQFMYGIKKKNGEWLDKGTGLSNTSVINALKNLEKYGFIKSYKKNGKTNKWEVVKKSHNQPMKKFHKGCEKSSQVTCEKTSHTIPNSTISNQTIDKSFNKFWEDYPKKTKKKNAKDIWKRKQLYKKLNEILEFIKKAKETERWKQGFIPDPTTFLNQERWEDDLSAYNSKVDDEEEIKIPEYAKGRSKTIN